MWQMNELVHWNSTYDRKYHFFIFIQCESHIYISQKKNGKFTFRTSKCQPKKIRLFRVTFPIRDPTLITFFSYNSVAKSMMFSLLLLCYTYGLTQLEFVILDWVWFGNTSTQKKIVLPMRIGSHYRFTNRI